jgi:exopolysaccharide biosynthesis protein
MNLPKLKLSILVKPLLLALFLAFISVIFYLIYNNYKRITEVESNIKTLQESLNITLFEDHLKISEQINLESQVGTVQTQLNELLTLKENQEYLKISEIYESYNLFSTNLNRNIKVNLDTKEFNDKVTSWGKKLIKKEFDGLKEEIDLAVTSLDNSYNKYLESIPKPTQVSGEGYSYVTVDSEKGKFGVYLIKVALSSVKVVTASANSDDCKDNCPTKSLADHVKDNGGYAGMNGAYFCPPDYSSCSGKVNSSDYAFYKSSSNKWLNKGALSWGDTGLATFNGNTPKFYKKSSDYGNGSVSAGISNYPTLLDNGEVVIDTGKLTSFQKDVKGPRGAIGVGDSNLYLVIISNATVVDAAYVMKALGAQDALNLDGGGSSAMYINGSYVVGPGRSLPNAVVLVK